MQTAWAAILATAAAAAAAQPDAPPYPFLLWTAQEAQAIRKRAAENAWAKKRLAEILHSAETPEGRRTFDNLFLYAVSGDRSAVEIEKKPLLDFIGCAPYKIDPLHWMWHHVDRYQHVLRYDTLYGELAPNERRALDLTFRHIAVHGIREERLRQWEGYPRMASASLCALITRDERLIRGAFECSGGLKDYLDQMVDGFFRAGSGNPPHKLLGQLMLWCRGCERLGLDELGFGYVGKNGQSVRKLLEGIARLGDPQLAIPGGMPYYGRSALHDVFHGGGMGFAMPPHDYLRGLAVAPIVMGRAPDGTGGWPLLSGGGAGEKAYQVFEQGGARMHLPLVFELAHRRWPGGPFGYFLAGMRGRDDKAYYPSPYWNLDPIDPQAVGPPPVASALHEPFGLAILRAQEGPDYWASPAPMAALRTGAQTRRQSGASCFALQAFFAFNRPIYFASGGTDKFDRRGNWYDSAASRCTVAVDNMQFGDEVREGRIYKVVRWPRPTGPGGTRHAFDNLVKFAGVRAVPTTYARPGPGGRTLTETAGLYPWLTTQRCLFLTREYLFDVFHLAGEKPYTYHWLVHAIGSAAPDPPAAWRETTDLDDELAGPDSVRFADQRRCDVGGRTWALTVVQDCYGKAPAESRMGKAWYDRKIGVRVTMLGEEGTKAYVAQTPGTVVLEGRREPRPPQPEDRYLLPKRSRDYDALDKGITKVTIPMPGQKPKGPPKPKQPPPAPPPKVLYVRETGGASVIARRRCPTTTFVVLHEPFAGGTPKIARFGRIQQTADALAVAVVGESTPVNDRVLLRLGDHAGQAVTLSGNGETFTFADRAYVRIAADAVRASGDLRAMKVAVPGRPRLILNGKPREAAVAGGFLTFGPNREKHR